MAEPRIDWQAVRALSGPCPVCTRLDEFGVAPEPCVNRGFSCDGTMVDYQDAEIACRESWSQHECWATGCCPACGVHLCDEHGADPGFHFARCKEDWR